MEDFKAGDVVELNSGGPKMTFTGFDKMFIDDNQKPFAFCQWWDQASNSFKSDRFSVSTIKKSE